MKRACPEAKTAPGQGVVAIQWLLSLLRAQYMSYQNSHWQEVGEGAYGNHLLFQRLYQGVDDDDGGIQDDVDELAERMVGLFGNTVVDMKHLVPKMSHWCLRWSEVSCHHARGLLSEQDFQQLCAYAMLALRTDGLLTPGLENLLQTLADRHESNVYLLQQVLRTPGE